MECQGPEDDVEAIILRIEGPRSQAMQHICGRMPRPSGRSWSKSRRLRSSMSKQDAGQVAMRWPRPGHLCSHGPRSVGLRSCASTSRSHERVFWLWRRSTAQCMCVVHNIFWQCCDDPYKKLMAQTSNVGSPIVGAMSLTTRGSSPCYSAS